MEGAIERGRPLPSWALDEPLRYPGDPFYHAAFWRLDSERQIGMAIGRIPHSKIEDHAFKKGLDLGMIQAFVLILGMMDRVYLKWCANEAERGNKVQNRRSR